MTATTRRTLTYLFLAITDVISYAAMPLLAIGVMVYANDWQQELAGFIYASWLLFLGAEVYNRRKYNVGLLAGIIAMDYEVRGFGPNLAYRLSLAAMQLCLMLWALGWDITVQLKTALIISLVVQELLFVYIHRQVWRKAKTEAKQRWSSLLQPR